MYKGEGRKHSVGKDTEASWVWGRQQSSRAEVGGGAGEETGNQVKWVSEAILRHGGLLSLSGPSGSHRLQISASSSHFG